MTTNPASGVRWDLSDLYKSADDPQIERDLKTAREKSVAFEKTYKPLMESLQKGTNGHLDLAALLSDYKKIVTLLTKPNVYVSLMFSEKTDDPARGALMQKIRTETTDIEAHLLFWHLIWNKLDRSAAEKFMSMPEVASDRHYLEHSRLYAPYTLSEAEEKIMSALSNTGGSAFSRLFDETMNSIEFYLEIDGKREKKTESEVLHELHSPDRARRRAASDSLAEGLKANTRLLTYIYNMILADHRTHMKLRSYRHPMDARNLANETDLATIQNLIASSKKNYATVARFYKLKARLLGLTSTTQEFELYRKNSRFYDIAYLTGFLNRAIMLLEKHYDKALLLDKGFNETIRKAEEFYDLTYKRDVEFIKNMFAKMDREGETKAILVTGGYHTPNLKELLKSRNASYVTVTPQVLHPTDHRRYEKLLLAQTLSNTADTATATAATGTDTTPPEPAAAANVQQLIARAVNLGGERALKSDLVALPNSLGSRAVNAFAERMQAGLVTDSDYITTTTLSRDSRVQTPSGAIEIQPVIAEPNGSRVSLRDRRGFLRATAASAAFAVTSSIEKALGQAVKQPKTKPNIKHKQIKELKAGEVAIMRGPKGDGYAYVFKDQAGKVQYLQPGVGVAVNDAPINVVNYRNEDVNSEKSYRRLYKALFEKMENPPRGYENKTIAEYLRDKGVNTVKLYLHANSPTDSELAQLEKDILALDRLGLSTYIMHFAGLYAVEDKDQNLESLVENDFLLNGTLTAAKKKVLTDDLRRIAAMTRRLGKAVRGIQLSNENAYYVKGAYKDPKYYFGGERWATINMTPAEYYKFMAELATVVKAADPLHPVVFGHGEMEPHQVQQMIDAGIGQAFDAIFLNIYPMDIVLPSSVDEETANAIANRFYENIRLAAAVGLPVGMGEFGKSSSKLAATPEEQEAKQAQIVGKLFAALSNMMIGGAGRVDTHYLTDIILHEGFSNNWKDSDKLTEGHSGMALFVREGSSHNHSPKTQVFDAITTVMTPVHRRFAAALKAAPVDQAPVAAPAVAPKTLKPGTTKKPVEAAKGKDVVKTWGKGKTEDLRDTAGYGFTYLPVTEDFKGKGKLIFRFGKDLAGKRIGIRLLGKDEGDSSPAGLVDFVVAADGTVTLDLASEDWKDRGPIRQFTAMFGTQSFNRDPPYADVIAAWESVELVIPQKAAPKGTPKKAAPGKGARGSRFATPIQPTIVDTKAIGARSGLLSRFNDRPFWKRVAAAWAFVAAFAGNPQTLSSQTKPSLTAPATKAVDAKNLKHKLEKDLKPGEVAIMMHPDGEGLVLGYLDPATKKVTYMPPIIASAALDARQNVVYYSQRQGRNYRNIYAALFDKMKNPPAGYENKTIADYLKDQGFNTIKFYLHADGLTDAEYAQLEKDVQRLYSQHGLRSFLMHFAGLYAVTDKRIKVDKRKPGQFIFNKPVTKDKLQIVVDDIRKLAEFTKRMGPALAGVQLGNENNYYVQGLGKIYNGGEFFQTIDLTPKQYFEFMAVLARAYKEADPLHPVFLGHGEMEPHHVGLMIAAGIPQAYDGLLLNLYLGHIVNEDASDEETVEQLAAKLEIQFKLAAQTGLPSGTGEWGKSGAKIGPDKQGKTIEKLARALAQFLKGGKRDKNLRVTIAMIHHEIFAEIWKDHAGAWTAGHSGMALFDSVGLGHSPKPAVFKGMSAANRDTAKAFHVDMTIAPTVPPKDTKPSIAPTPKDTTPKPAPVVPGPNVPGIPAIPTPTTPAPAAPKAKPVEVTADGVFLYRGVQGHDVYYHFDPKKREFRAFDQATQTGLIDTNRKDHEAEYTEQVGKMRDLLIKDKLEKTEKGLIADSLLRREAETLIEEKEAAEWLKQQEEEELNPPAPAPEQAEEIAEEEVETPWYLDTRSPKFWAMALSGLFAGLVLLVALDRWRGITKWGYLARRERENRRRSLRAPVVPVPVPASAPQPAPAPASAPAAATPATPPAATTAVEPLPTTRPGLPPGFVPVAEVLGQLGDATAQPEVPSGDLPADDQPAGDHLERALENVRAPAMLDYLVDALKPPADIVVVNGLAFSISDLSRLATLPNDATDPTPAIRTRLLAALRQLAADEGIAAQHDLNSEKARDGHPFGLKTSSQTLYTVDTGTIMMRESEIRAVFVYTNQNPDFADPSKLEPVRFEGQQPVLVRGAGSRVQLPEWLKSELDDQRAQTIRVDDEVRALVEKNQAVKTAIKGADFVLTIPVSFETPGAVKFLVDLLAADKI